MRWLFIFFNILSLGIANQAAAALPISTTVDGGYSYGKHLECRAYLHISENIRPNTANNKTLHFFQPGTGAYTTYFDTPWTDNTDYYLTIDKPGIIPNPNNPHEPIVDRQLFDYYTTDTLVNCASNALFWADDYFKNTNISIVLGGHSEGSIVMTRLVYNTLINSSKTPLHGKISALFLSGIVMDNMSDVLAFQLNKISYDKFMVAYKAHDDNYFYKNYQVGWYWVDNSLKSDYPIKKTLDDIATSSVGRTLPIQMFQGLWDRNVPTKSVLTYEENNNKKTTDNMLTLLTRYYNAGHSLNATAITDMQLLIDKYLIINNSASLINTRPTVSMNNNFL
jgi:hypothetical protein